MSDGDSGGEGVPDSGAEAVRVPGAETDSEPVALPVEKGEEEPLRVALAEREVVEELVMVRPGVPVVALLARLERETESVTASLGLPAALTVCVRVAAKLAPDDGDTSAEGVTSALSVGASVTVCVPVFSKRCVMLMAAVCDADAEVDSRADSEADTEGKDAVTEGEADGDTEPLGDLDSLAEFEGEGEPAGEGVEDADTDAQRDTTSE